MKTLIATSATVAVLFALFPVQSVSAQEIGKTVRVVNAVSGNLAGKSRNLSKSDPVFSTERISAAADSHGEIQLSDNSKIIVGPGATISLDDFVVSPNGIGAGTLNVVKGAFRFASGRGKKANYKIQTPLATIGIRGTRFDVYVAPNGQTDVVHFSGRIEVCTNGGNCRTMSNACDVLRVKPGNSVKFLNFLRSGVRKEENALYNLVSDQTRFPPAWRAPTALCSQRARLEIEGHQGGDPSDPPSNNPSPDYSYSE